jgi:uncharacterized protein (DUF1778 family)
MRKLSNTASSAGGTSPQPSSQIKTSRASSSVARIGLRFSPEANYLVEEAANVLGMTINAFATAEIVERSREILREARGLSLDNAARDRFLALLDNADGPNDSLKAAAERYKRGRLSEDEYRFEG